MRKELAEALLLDFPNVFKPHPQSLVTMFGFECGDGWEPIIREAAAALEVEIAKHKASPEFDHDNEWAQDVGSASQIKEKFATLRFYLNTGTDAMWKIVNDAELKSEDTCESCGEPGKVRGRSWFYNACDTCEEKRNK